MSAGFTDEYTGFTDTGLGFTDAGRGFDEGGNGFDDLNGLMGSGMIGIGCGLFRGTSSVS